MAQLIGTSIHTLQIKRLLDFGLEMGVEPSTNNPSMQVEQPEIEQSASVESSISGLTGNFKSIGGVFSMIICPFIVNFCRRGTIYPKYWSYNRRNIRMVSFSISSTPGSATVQNETIRPLMTRVSMIICCVNCTVVYELFVANSFKSNTWHRCHLRHQMYGFLTEYFTQL